MTIDWSKTKKYAQLVQIAGQVLSGDYSDALKADIAALGYSFLEPILGNDFHGVTVTFGFVAISPDKECVCALRGTAVKDILEWLDDIEAIPVPSPIGPGLVHLGFKDVHGSLRLPKLETQAADIPVGDYIRSVLATGQSNKVVVTGHSLGGALASLVAMEQKDTVTAANIESYTFASPRVGDHSFVNWYDGLLRDSTFRMENCFDAVPNLPTNPPFQHVNAKFRVVGDFLEPVWKQHELATYLALIEKHLK